MLADIGGDDSFPFRKVAENIEYVLGSQASSLGIFKREFILPDVDLLEPVPGVEAIDMLDQLL